MLSERAEKIKPSPTLAIDAKAKAMKASGIDVVNLGLGEPDFDTPDNIKEAGIRAIRDGFTKYTAVGGIDQLKDAVIEKLNRDNGLEYARENILVSCGAKHSLYNIAQALYNPGDEVIIPSPFWVSYPDQVIINDALPVIVKTFEKDGFTLRQEMLEERITSKTKAIILNSPSNPTGFTYTKKALEQIAETALRHNLYVISDEIYEKLLYDGTAHTSIASLGREIMERTIVVNGLSKSHAMTGWRIGYAAGPKGIIKAMTNIQSQSTSNPNSIAQMAAIEALKGPQDFTATMVREFDRRREFLISELNAIRNMTCIKPTGAFYAFPNTSRIYNRSTGGKIISSSSDLALYLLEDAHVALVPGEAFGDDGFLRLSYATSMDNISKAVARIRDAVSRLQ